jgi:FkbM family methyltransferase
VGANIGVHTVVLGRAAAPGRVVACEPNSALIERLRANIALNRLRNVTVCQVALGAAPGRAALYVPSEPEHTAGASLGRGVHVHLDTARELEVEVTTLDALAQREGLKDVALVKVDVEGMEPAVLQGGRELLRRDRPVLIFECTPGWWAKLGYNLETVSADLAELGYDAPRRITWRGLRPLPQRLPEAMNLIAMPR